MSDVASFSSALPPGTRIGPVVLGRAIGQGAWGIVYEGQHDLWGHVAIKEFFPTTYAARQTGGGVGSSAPQWQDAVRKGRERFALEARTLKQIRHENVVAVHEYLEENGAAFLVMDYVEGQLLSAAHDEGRFSDPQTVMAFAETMIDTLHAIHAKNILHRDIAPDNIMVRADGSPVLIDFGGAAAAVASATRSTNNIVKDGYSPPEQYDAAANPMFPVGPWSDIYATAAVLYRLTSGNEPAVSNTRLLGIGIRKGSDPLIPLKSIAPPGYPPKWLEAVDSALALAPTERPQKAADWRRMFDASTLRPAARSNSFKLIGFAVLATALITAVVAALIVQFGHFSAPAARVAPPAAVVAHAPAPPKPKPRVAAVPRHTGQTPTGYEVMYDSRPGVAWKVTECNQTGGNAIVGFRIFNGYAGKMFYDVAITNNNRLAADDWIPGRQVLSPGLSPTILHTVRGYTCGPALYAALRNVHFNSESNPKVSFP